MGKPTLIRTREGEVIKLKTSKTKAIKLRCLDCVGFERKNIKSCDNKKCFLFPHRLGRNKKHTTKERNLAIKEYCTKCVNGEKREIKKCSSVTCPLFPHRRGAKKTDIENLTIKRHKRKRKITNNNTTTNIVVRKKRRKINEK